MIYSSIEISKSGFPIPIFKDRKPMHSKYDPVREAQSQCAAYQKKDIFVFFGMGAAYLQKEMRKRFSDSIIIIYENSKEDIDFLFSSIDGLHNWIEKENIHVFTIDNIESTLPQFFIPAITPDLEIIDNRNWLFEISEKMKQIKDSVQKTISAISKDYSVQCHFGKFFQNNMLKNARFLKQNETCFFNTEKNAAIIAAGPSLDFKIKWLKDNKENLVIFSTDTANQVLKKHNIKPDWIVTMDGQWLSEKHFFCENFSKGKYIMDFSGNPSIFRKIVKNNGKLICASNNHPFIQYIKNSTNNEDFSIKLNSGSGTVTIMACDMALKAGFKKIFVIGADFGYINNKPYAKGTYLDDIYGIESSLIDSVEKKFCKLMFRNEKLIQENNKTTTSLLKSYAESFENWAKENDLIISKTDYLYTLNKKNPQNTFSKQKIKEKESFIFNLSNIDFEDLSKKIKLDAEKSQESLKKYESIEDFFKNKNTNTYNESLLKIALLPYIAFLRNKLKGSQDFSQLFNIALQDLLRYTI